MKRLFLLAGFAASLMLVTGCSTTGTLRSPYNAVAYKPHNPDSVRVKVSLANRAVYVMEGDRPLLVTATAIGKADHPTHTGNYRVFNKIEKKRSGSYGFSISGDGSIHPTTAGAATGRYVGYPMPYWVEYDAGYGFHEGSVWPTPRSHGCLRLHKNVAPKFFALAKIGTPINIAQTQPEDATIGKNLKRPTDYADPDPASSIMVSDRAFSAPAGPLLVDGPQ
jgi:hypothetical protein